MLEFYPQCNHVSQGVDGLAAFLVQHGSERALSLNRPAFILKRCLAFRHILENVCWEELHIQSG